MPVIAIVNGKGGSGKSTVATHLAAWCARNGKAVMLGDVDRQQSTRTWLRRRDASLPTISSWASTQTNTLRVPNGITHVILDTPGGMHGYDLARVVMFADAILMPIGNSIFDREAAAVCQAELLTMPRVANGRCRLAGMGMRIDSRPHASKLLREWACDQKLPFIGVLRENNQYVQCLERGMTLFDLPHKQTHTDLDQWKPILDWLRPVLEPASAVAAPAAAAPVAVASRLGPVLQRSNLRDTVIPGERPVPARPEIKKIVPTQQPLPHAPAAPAVVRPVNADHYLQIPSFLRQAS
jgi:chromosome partitioning protein